MNDTNTKAPLHLWAVGVLTLLWNSVGIMSYMTTRLGKLESAGMTPEQISFMDGFPIWVNTLWALGVWGAFAASLLILARSKWAVTSLYIALVGLAGTTFYQRAMTDLPEGMEGIGLPIAIWVITLFMLWYTLRMRAAGVLR